MKEFILLFRGGDGSMLKQQTPDKWQEYMQRWMDWMSELTAQGKFAGAQPLKKEGKVVTGTKKTVTDGPFMEGKELVGGYLICKVESEAEAVEIAHGCPILEFDDGAVEVREVSQM